MDPDVLSALGARIAGPGATAGARGQGLVRLPWRPGGDRLWLPVVDGRVPPAAFELHAPCSARGRWARRIASSLLRLPGACGLWTRCTLVLDRAADVPRLLRSVFPRDRVRLAVRVSGLGDRRRIIVQVAGEDGRPLGYLKLGLGAGAVERLRNEAAALAHVRAADAVLAERTPEPIHTGPLGGGYALLLTAVEGGVADAPFGSGHEDLLRRLGRIDRHEVSGGALVTWIERRIATGWNGDRSDEGDGAAGSGGPDGPDGTEHGGGLAEAALARAAAWLEGRTVRIGRVHGDFAPWNLRASPGGLCALDWERSESGLPGCWDRFHFELQARALLGRPGSAPHGPGGLDGWAPADDAGRALLLLYLLDSAAWLSRERGPRWRTALEFRWRVLRELLA